jgi:hypothetical protein
MSQISEEALQSAPVPSSAAKRKTRPEPISVNPQMDGESQSKSSPDDHPLTQADPVVLPKVSRIGEKVLQFEDYEKKIEDLQEQFSALVKLLGFVNDLDENQRTLLLAKLIKHFTAVHEEFKMIKPDEKAKELWALLLAELLTTHKCSNLLVTFLKREQVQ